MKAETIDIDVRPPQGLISYYSYSVRLVDEKALNFHTWEYREKHELSILVGGALGHTLSGVHIRTKEIAEEYRRKNILRWKKKWGQNIEVDIITISTSDRKSFFKVLEHTDVILSRLKK